MYCSLIHLNLIYSAKRFISLVSSLIISGVTYCQPVIIGVINHDIYHNNKTGFVEACLALLEVCNPMCPSHIDI